MTAPTIDQIIDDILKAEGGYVDHPNDPGGATNHGISLRYAQGVGLDLDGDGDTDKDDIVLVTQEVARSYYLRDFWAGPRIRVLPAEIQPVITDWAVNSGPPRAIIGLQNVLNEAGFGYLSPDGVIGRMTRTAAERAQESMGPYLTNAIVDERNNFYRALAMNRPQQFAVFLRGWLARSEKFRLEIH